MESPATSMSTNGRQLSSSWLGSGFFHAEHKRYGKICLAQQTRYKHWWKETIPNLNFWKCLWLYLAFYLLRFRLLLSTPPATPRKFKVFQMTLLSKNTVSIRPLVMFPCFTYQKGDLRLECLRRVSCLRKTEDRGFWVKQ